MADKTYTISDNLELLAQNKQAIKNAIIAKGGSITDSTPLSEYATQIESLPSGGGSSTDYYVSGTSSANTFTVQVNNTNVTPTFTASGSGYTWKVDLNSYEVANLNQFAFNKEAITSVDMSHAGNAVDMTNAFGSCSSLTAYTPNALDACIYYSQFYGTGLSAYTIPSYCACIGDQAFFNCKAMTSVDVPENAVMGDSCFSQAGLTSVSMYNRQSIPVATFQHCRSLVTINQNFVNIVGDRAFLNCVNFNPDEHFFGKLRIIGESAFQGCTALDEISFTYCNSIGANAFKGCTGLNGIWFKGDEHHVAIPTLGVGAFDNTNDCPIYVPSGRISEFLAVEGWAAYESRLQESAADGIKFFASDEDMRDNINEVFAGYTDIPVGELPVKLYVGYDDNDYHHFIKVVILDDDNTIYYGDIDSFNSSDTFEKSNIQAYLMDRVMNIFIDDTLQRKIKFTEQK